MAKDFNAAKTVVLWEGKNVDVQIFIEGLKYMLKDYWGNDALDFGNLRDLKLKHRDKILVTVTNKPFGDSYLLFICNEGEHEKADAFLSDYHKMMEARGITAYGAGTTLGADLYSKKMDGFQGGAGSI